MRAGRKNRDGTWDPNGPVFSFDDPGGFGTTEVEQSGRHVVFTYEPADETSPPQRFFMRRSDAAQIARYFVWLATQLGQTPLCAVDECMGCTRCT